MNYSCEETLRRSVSSERNANGFAWLSICTNTPTSRRIAVTKRRQTRTSRIAPAKGVDRTSQKSDTPSVGSGGQTDVRIFQNKPGDVPLLEFFDERKSVEMADIRAAIGRLAKEGFGLRPPANEHLGGQLYYLRIQSEDGTYRLFYWPFGKGVVILGHGFSKKTNTCPPNEIKRALKCRKLFESDPEHHTFTGDVADEDAKDNKRS